MDHQRAVDDLATLFTGLLPGGHRQLPAGGIRCEIVVAHQCRPAVAVAQAAPQQEKTLRNLPGGFVSK